MLVLACPRWCVYGKGRRGIVKKALLWPIMCLQLCGWGIIRRVEDSVSFPTLSSFQLVHLLPPYFWQHSGGKKSSLRKCSKMVINLLRIASMFHMPLTSNSLRSAKYVFPHSYMMWLLAAMQQNLENTFSSQVTLLSLSIIFMLRDWTKPNFDPVWILEMFRIWYSLTSKSQNPKWENLHSHLIWI